MNTISGIMPNASFKIERLQRGECEVIFFTNVKEIENVIEGKRVGKQYEYDLYRFKTIYRENLVIDIENNYEIWLNAAIESECNRDCELTEKEEIKILKEENEKLKNMDTNLISTNWDTDYRLCEVEWMFEDTGLGQSIPLISLKSTNAKERVNNIALTRCEQAKIMILGGKYNKKTLTRQLTTYFNRNYLTQEEYDELIALMEAREMVEEN